MFIKYMYIFYVFMYVCVFETIGKVMISQTHFKTPKLRILEKWFETLNQKFHQHLKNSIYQRKNF